LATRRVPSVLLLPLLLAALGAPTRAERPPDPRNEPSEQPPLEIVALSIRSHGLRDGQIEVAVTARDAAGIGRVEVDCGAGQRRLVEGRGRTALSALVRCRPGEEIRAVAFSRDGTRSGAPAVRPFVRHDHGEDIAHAAVGPLRKRLADRGYPQRVGAFDESAANLVPLLPGGQPWWLRWADSPHRKPFDFTAHCGAGVTKIAPDGAALRCWLELHPRVRASIVWNEYHSPGVMYPPGTKVRGIAQKHLPYDQWTEDMKTWLDVSVYWAHAYLEGGLDWFPGQYLPDTPPNLVQLGDHEWATTVLERDDVWKLYLGTIAHSLALEIGRFVPWSIADYTDMDLRLLFHSDLLVQPQKSTTTGVATFVGYQPKRVLPSPPTRVFEFFVYEDLIRPSAFSTVAKLLQWGRYGGHLFHDRVIPDLCFPGTNLCSQVYYGYRGTAPAIRLLEGTSYTDVAPPYITWGPAGWVPGCHGMAALLQHALRVLNIPVDGGPYTWVKGHSHGSSLGKTGHSTPFFWTLGRTLSHGDDVYSVGNESTPPFPGHWLLLPLETYEHWFLGAGKLGLDGHANVGRQAHVEVPLRALSDALLQRYCVDQQSGAGHADGALAAYFHNEVWNVAYYDVAQLEALDLWDELAVKAAALGFCD